MAIYVNREEIAEDILQQELQMLLQRYRQEMAPEEIEEKEEEIREDAKQNAIERLILTQKAREEMAEVSGEEIEYRYEELKKQHGGGQNAPEQIDLEPEEEEKVKSRIEDGIRLEHYFDQITADTAPPQLDECRRFYEQNISRFEYPEMLRAAHIVRQPEQGRPPEQLLTEMMNIREKLLKGAAFAELANAHSQCDDNGGDLGWFPRGQMVPEFEDVVFAMAPGEISDVFQTPFGFHIVKVFDKKAAGCQDFEDVRYEIENELLELKKNEKIGAIVDELRKDAVIEETAEKAEETQ